MPKTIKVRSLSLLLGSLAVAVIFIGGSFYLAKAAATPVGGDLIKGSTSGVYYVTADGKRLAFPNAATYFSWYADFSKVKVFSSQQVEALPLAGFVTLRPGESPVKFKSASKVYAVAAGGVLRHLQTAVEAAMIFGADWNKKIVIMPDAFSASYTVGAVITGPGEYWWKQEMDKSPTIAADLAAKSAAATPVPPNTNTNIPVNAPPVATTSIEGANGFKISKVSVLSVDDDGNKAENIRTFEITMSGLAKNVQLVVNEKATGKVFYSNLLLSGAITSSNFIEATVGNIDNGLKPSTAYTWKVAAVAATAAASDKQAVMTGEFTTADFNPADQLLFKIIKVSVLKLDAESFPAEDVRSFELFFSHQAKNVVLTITEKNTGTVFHTESVANGATVDVETEVLPNDWTIKLKPNTTYSWKVTADAAVAVSGDATATGTGEFTTSNFDPAKSLIFKIDKVLLGIPIVSGNLAYDLRDFNITFLNPAKNVTLTITEKNTGTVFHTESVANGAIIRDVLGVHMIDWNLRLQPNTAYSWKVTADAASPSAMGQSDTATGDFATAATF